MRIGYTTPDIRRGRTVELIAESCRDAGIDVVDAGSETFVPSQLGAGEIDASSAGRPERREPAAALIWKMLAAH